MCSRNVTVIELVFFPESAQVLRFAERGVDGEGVGSVCRVRELASATEVTSASTVIRRGQGMASKSYG